MQHLQRLAEALGDLDEVLDPLVQRRDEGVVFVEEPRRRTRAILVAFGLSVIASELHLLPI